MRFVDFLTEARRKPRLNPPQSMLEQLQSIADAHASDAHSLFVTFTNVNKLGIYPISSFNTPIGIYTYPLQYVLKESERNAKIPFGHSRQYAIVAQATGKVIRLNQVSPDDANDYLHDLANVLMYRYNVADVDPREVYDKQSGSPGARLWYTVYRLGDFIAWKSGKQNPHAADSQTQDDEAMIKHTTQYGDIPKERRTFDQYKDLTRNLTWLVSPARSLVASALFRAVGIQGVVDPGMGVIHPNEPTQAVFFRASALKQIATLRNTYDKDLQLPSEITKRAANIAADPERLTTFVGKITRPDPDLEKEMLRQLYALGSRFKYSVDPSKLSPLLDQAIKYRNRVKGGRWPELTTAVQHLAAKSPRPERILDYYNSLSLA